MHKKPVKILSILLCLSLLLQQTGFAQIANVELNIAGHLAQIAGAFTPDRFRPLHLRSISYDAQANDFKLLLDKGDFIAHSRTHELENTTQDLLNYFFVGLSLPNNAFWVNLRPDSPNDIIDPLLAQTDVGKILLEADLQLKKDTASATSPQTVEGKEYWNKLYQKAEELYGSQNVTIPTLTRPWIVPDEIIIRESTDSAYVYKATLKVMLEQDYLKGDAVYAFKDKREKELNEYSSQIMREEIIPKLTKEINNAKRYAPLRQVYYSLILAQWFKSRNQNKNTQYANLIDRKDLSKLQARTEYSVATYFNAYKENFAKGQYNIKEPIYTPYGQSIRSYFSGGEILEIKNFPSFGNETTDSAGTHIVSVPAIREFVNNLKKKLLLVTVTGIFTSGLIFSAGDLNAQELPKSDNMSQEELSKELSVARLVDLASQGNLEAANKLDSLASQGNFTVLEALRTLDPTKLAQLASQGNSEAVENLVDLAHYCHNSAAEEALQTLDITKFAQLVSQEGNIEAVKSLKHLVSFRNNAAEEALRTLDPTKLAQLASQGNNAVVESLVDLAAKGNSAALNTSVTLASQGNLGAVRNLINLAFYDINTAKEALRTLDPTKLAQLASQGNNAAVWNLVDLAHYCHNSAAKEALRTLDPTKLAQLASQGNKEAAKNLIALTFYDNNTAKEALRTLDTAKLAQLASQGNSAAVENLKDLIDFNNNIAKKVLRTLNTAKLAQLASQGNSEAVESLMDLIYYGHDYSDGAAKKESQTLDVTKLAQLAFQGNNAAVQNLVSLATEGNSAAFNTLVTLASQGNSEAIQNLAQFISQGNNKVVLNVFVTLASQGNSAAVQRLSFVADKGISAAEEALRTLDITKIVQLASQGNTTDFSSLARLAYYNHKALDALFEMLVTHRTIQDPGGYILKNEVCLPVVRQINYLHESSDSVRFASVSAAQANMLYLLMVYGQEEIFTSSFNGLFNRLLERMQKEGLSGEQLLTKVDYNKLRVFIKLCASFNRLNEFLNTFNTAEAKSQFIQSFVKDLDKSNDPLGEAVAVSDMFSVIQDKNILTILQDTIKSEYERVLRDDKKDAQVLYGLLAGMFSKKAIINNEWLREMATKYQLANISELPQSALVDSQGRHVERYFFYDDGANGDGEASFNNFVATFKNGNWRLEDFPHYICIKSTSGTSVAIYANKPKFGREGGEDIRQVFQESNLKPQILVHRGHSYHADSTIEKIDSNIKLVYLGSCGGYNNVKGVLDRSPAAHILSTKGTGTMTVNDPVLRAIVEHIRQGQGLNWERFKQEAERALGGNDAFHNYVFPHENLGVMFLKAYNRILDQQGKISRPLSQASPTTSNTDFTIGNSLPSYTGAGKTSIHAALDDAQDLINKRDFALARTRLIRLLAGLNLADKNQDIDPLMEEWDSLFPSGMPVPLSFSDIPGMIRNAEALLAQLSSFKPVEAGGLAIDKVVLRQKAEALIKNAGLSGGWLVERYMPDLDKAIANAKNEDFMVNLAGLLKYLKLMSGRINQPSLSEEEVRLIITRALNVSEDKIVRMSQREGQKIAFLVNGQVVRAYDVLMLLALKNKVEGTSEADLARQINNDLLVVRISDVLGEPLDIAEQVIPLNEAINIARQNNDSELLNLFEEAKSRNPLIAQHIIEAKDENIGLVVREFEGRKYVYLVAFDFDEILYNKMDRLNQDQMRDIKEAKPLGIPYERIEPIISRITRGADEIAVVEPEAGKPAVVNSPQVNEINTLTQEVFDKIFSEWIFGASNPESYPHDPNPFLSKYDPLENKIKRVLNPLFDPVAFAQIFRAMTIGIKDPVVKKQVFEAVIEKCGLSERLDIFWKVYEKGYQKWQYRDTSQLAERISKLQAYFVDDRISDKLALMDIMEYLIQKRTDIPKEELEDMLNAARFINDLINKGVAIDEDPDVFISNLEKVHALAAQSLFKGKGMLYAGKQRKASVEHTDRNKGYLDGENLTSAMEAFARYVCSDSFKKLSAVMQGATMYYVLTDMQYFMDGNRRVAKLFRDYYLIRGHLPPLEINDENKNEFIRVAQFMKSPDEIADFIAEQLLLQLEKQKLEGVLPANSEAMVANLKDTVKSPEVMVPVQNNTWEKAKGTWDKRRTEIINKIREAKSIEEKVNLIKELNGKVAGDEIKAIENLENESNDIFYSRFSFREQPWYSGLKTQEVNGKYDPDTGMSLAKHRIFWDNQKVKGYYYHGTSLGVAMVSVVRGVLGGINEFAFNREEGDGVDVFFVSPDLYVNGDNINLGNLLIETGEYARRAIRPGRAISLYYALRLAWEKEGRKELFPPFKYFMQKAIIRVPRGDMTVVGDPGQSSLRSLKPVNLDQAEIVVDQDIPLPSWQEIDYDSLSRHDPESLFSGVLSSQDLEQVNPLISKQERAVFPIGYDRRTFFEFHSDSIGELIENKWMPIDKLLNAGISGSQGQSSSSVSAQTKQSGRGGILDPSLRSGSISEEKKGGIDFRFLPIVTQAMDNLKASIKTMPRDGLRRMNLTKEWSDIERLVDSGITPSAERLKDYLAASTFKNNINNDMDKIVSCISDILRMEEESCFATDPTLKDILVVLGSGRSGEDLKMAFSGKS